MLSSWSLSIRRRKGISLENLISPFGGGPRSHTVHTACHQGRLVVFASARMKHLSAGHAQDSTHPGPPGQPCSPHRRGSVSPAGGGSTAGLQVGVAGKSRGVRAGLLQGSQERGPRGLPVGGSTFFHCSLASSLLGSPGRSPATGVLGPGT